MGLIWRDTLGTSAGADMQLRASSYTPARMRTLFNAALDWCNAIPTTTARCPLCGYSGLGDLVNRFYVTGRRSGSYFYTVRCPYDGMMYLDPQPTEAFYQELYDGHYHGADPAHPLFEQGCINLGADPQQQAHKARLNLDQVERYLTPLTPAKTFARRHFIEVGFGDGAVLAEAYRRGWEVFGLERSRAAVLRVRGQGLPALDMEFLQLDLDQTPDVIALYSVLEHVESPRACVRHARALLADDGILVLRIPDTPDRGPTLALFEHRWHFNQRTITRLLEQEGFRVCEISGFGAWRGTRYEGSVVSMNVVAKKAHQQKEARP